MLSLLSLIKKNIRIALLILYFSLLNIYINFVNRISAFFKTFKIFINEINMRIFERPKLQIDRQTILANHLYVVYPYFEKFLDQLFYSFQNKDFLVLKNSNISQITFDSKEFKIIAEKFFLLLKRSLGKSVYREIEKYWGEEEFKEFVMLWLYYKLTKELLDNIKNLVS